MRHLAGATVVLLTLGLVLPAWSGRAGAQAPAVPLKTFPASPDTSYANANNFLKIGDTWFFSALQRELWKSDGTPAGTVLVKDLGSTSDATFFTELNGRLFFSNGALWTSDGTPAGTFPVKDTHGAYQLSFITNVGGTLFFSASDVVHGAELWKSDGTTAGTVMVKEIRPGQLGSFPSNLTNVDGILFFSADDGVNGEELWKSDGTAAGTVLVKDIDPGSASAIAFSTSFAAVGRTLFFAANDGVNGEELWKSDGTAAGTVLVKDVNPGSASSQPRRLANVGGALVFSADDGTNGINPWRSDGTSAGTTHLANVYPGSGAGGLSPFVHAAGTVFFWGTTTGGADLWQTDGTSAGTMLVSAALHAGNVDITTSLSAANGVLLAAADDGTDGTELWRSDGTPAGTTLVKDINPGAASSINVFGATSDGPLLFSADDGVHGIKPWVSDGTSAGTLLLKSDFESSRAYTYSPAGAGPITIDVPQGTDFNGKLLTSWFCDIVGAPTFCWTDGTPGGTSSATFSALSIDTPFTVAGTHAYFGSLNLNTGAGGLYRTDGTQATTFTINAGSTDDGITGLIGIGSRLFYSYEIGKYSANFDRDQLWTSTGTAGSTVKLQDTADTSVYDLTVVGGTLMYAVGDLNAQTSSLWKSNGTVAGTVQVQSFDPYLDGTGSVGSMVAVGSTIYFIRSDGVSRWGLWKSDGTAAGTVLVKDIAYYSEFIYNDEGYLTNVNGTLYFVGEDVSILPIHRVLWKSDGTTAGTVIVADVGPSVVASPGPVIQDLTNVNGTLLFFADDGVHGLELWKSDGTAVGTGLVKDIVPGPGSPFPFDVYQVVHRTVGNHLFFAADDVITGSELWRSDGTAAGTFRFADVQPGPFSSGPSNLTVAGPNLYFNADTIPSGGMGAGAWWVPNAVTCGNGLIDPGEPCDDSNLDNGDGCTVACTVSGCGDGFVAGAEQCDDGNTIDTDACPSTCMTAACGDGFLQADIEGCDDGNVTSGDGCDADCTPTSCGNGIATAGEECDAGLLNGDGPCSRTCVLCGNGIMGPGEECDDGNTNDADGCTNRCTACGNGVVGPGEECDDANLTNGDGCDANCRLTGCGNGILNAGEQCDDDNRLGGDCCSSSCQLDTAGTVCTTDGNQCTDDVCDGAGLCLHPNNSGPCDDGQFCNGADSCSSGACTQHAGNPCVGGPECANTCNEATATCFVTGGTACSSDGNPCTTDRCNGSGTCTHPAHSGSCDDGLFCDGTDTCSSGACVHSGDPCAAGPACANVCSEASDSCFTPNGTPCTSPSDVCLHGTCDGGGSCAATDAPAPTCLSAAKSQLAIVQSSVDASDKLSFKWKDGAPIAPAALGDPTATDAYTLCVYDSNGLVARAVVPAGGLCSGKPCWTPKSTGFKYKDKLGTNDGVMGVLLKASAEPKSSAKLKGKGVNLPDPTLPLVPPVTSQLIRSGGSLCLGGTYAGAQIRRNDAGEFSAKTP